MMDSEFDKLGELKKILDGVAKKEKLKDEFEHLFRKHLDIDIKFQRDVQIGNYTIFMYNDDFKIALDFDFIKNDLNFDKRKMSLEANNIYYYLLNTNKFEKLLEKNKDDHIMQNYFSSLFKTFFG